jgi:NTP pyrophosphatase (non-canonical NTP hydrolase)
MENAASSNGGNPRRPGTGHLAKLSMLCVADSKRWFGDQGASTSVPHMTLAMCGEVGEFANVVKKIERGSLDLGDANTRVKLASELCDVLVYLLNIAGMLNIDMDIVFDGVRANNERRFMEERRVREAKK